MIFIALFLFIALLIIGLNMYNSSNLETIEEYIKSKNCNDYIYARGSYKAICDDFLLEVSNSFSVDLQKDSKMYKYSDINSLEINNLDLIINKEYKLKFKEKNNLDNFYNKLSLKLKQDK